MEELNSIPEISKSQTRQLAAVMFTDMMGYTAMMQEDEQKAKREGRTSRSEQIKGGQIGGRGWCTLDCHRRTL